MKFKLLAGTHIENKKQYNALTNNLFESEVEWDRLFPQRFQAIDATDRPSERPPKKPDVSYKLKRRRGGYDVVREHDEKVMNDDKVSKEEAEKLIKSLEV